MLIGSFLEPSDVISLGIGKVLDLGLAVIGTISSRQMSQYRLDTDRVDDYMSVLYCSLFGAGLTHIGFTCVQE